MVKKKHVYFMGICGTGMASVAGLCQEAGYQVSGSDANIYPPMSTMLEDLGIKTLIPYSKENLQLEKPDLIVIANALSRGNVELEEAIEKKIPYTSFPALLGDEFLDQRSSVVITGTHGKTTTSSLLTHVLEELGENPGFMIGGIPKNFPRSFRLGKGDTFVIEGDEYDTAFFDKGPKFLHYRPKFLVVNNIEFDHADIFANVEAIEAEFAKVIKLVPKEGAVIANMSDARVAKLIHAMLAGKQLNARLYQVRCTQKSGDASETLSDVNIRKIVGVEISKGVQKWSTEVETKSYGVLKLDTSLAGKHNISNLGQVVGCLIALADAGVLKNKLTAEKIINHVKTFKSVARRLDFLGSHNNIDVYEDFAHHPTAVELVIQAYKEVCPGRRLIVAFEPKNATSRRNVFQNQYVKSLSFADEIFIAPSPVDLRIHENQRMNTQQLAQSIGKKAHAFDSNEQLLVELKKILRSNDTVLFMSSSSFTGIQHKLINDLALA